MLTNFLLILRNFRLAALLVRLALYTPPAGLCRSWRFGPGLTRIELTLADSAPWGWEEEVEVFALGPPLGDRWPDIERWLDEASGRLLAERARVPWGDLVGAAMGGDGASELGEGR
jgi:hypothetical protein